MPRTKRASLTPTQQRNAVSEGLALGLVALGRASLPDGGVAVDEAFAQVWRRWPYRERFARVGHDVAGGIHGLHVATRATQGKRTATFFWLRDAHRLNVRRRDAADCPTLDFLPRAAQLIDGGVPLTGWIALARAFLGRYNPQMQSRTTAQLQ